MSIEAPGRLTATDLTRPEFPDWAREFYFAVRARTTNLVILAGNVDDLIDLSFLQIGETVMSVEEFVNRLATDLSVQQPFTQRVVLSLALGAETRTHDGAPAPSRGPAPAESHNPSSELFKTLAGLHRSFFADEKKPEQTGPRRQDTDPRKKPRSLIVFTDVERLAAGYHADAGLTTQSIVDLLCRWPRNPDPDLRRVLAIGYAREPGAVSAALCASGARLIRIPLPEATARRRFIERHMTAEIGDRAKGEALDGLVNITVGLTLRELRNTARQVEANRAPELAAAGVAPRDPWRDRPQFATDLFDERLLRLRKSELIVGASQGLLEEVPTQFGWDAVGGLGHVVEELKRMATYVRAPDGDPRRELIPRGVLLVGAPGTGKTLIARVLARESRMNMVKMKDVRVGFVGESERNLTRVLRLIKERRPVVVFVDEIDQAIGRRSTGQSLDAGTSERMFGQILEFIGDPLNRGQVIWVAASNRPDHLDSALLSRFDRVIPVLLPDRVGRAEILTTLQAQIGFTFEFSLTAVSGRAPIEVWEGDDALRSTLDRTEGLSGRALEAIARRAMQVASEHAVGGQPRGVTVSSVALGQAASEFMRNYDQPDYELQDLLAVRACNFTSQLPPLASLQTRHHFADVVVGGNVDPAALENAITRRRPSFAIPLLAES